MYNFFSSAILKNVYFFNFREAKKNQPDILFGKSCYDLPVKEISRLSVDVTGAYTGPAGGLTKVNRRQRALSVSDPDVDFIDEDSILADDLRDDGHSNDGK